MNTIINHTISYVQTELKNAEGGHDWWHSYRVWQLAKKLAAYENSNILVVELAALLHDIADSKFYSGDETIGPKKAKAFLEKLEIDIDIVHHVIFIIENISFKNINNQIEKSIEFKIVQDADRLDAIGAIGIARTFNYGGFKNRSIYNPDIKPNFAMTKDEYKRSDAPTLNHFYEKLLLLKDLMNTPKAKEIANKRHRFMEQFLNQFYTEWEQLDFE
ncbi:MAG: HD domain-containing protein [Bacteroidales bacterium]|nr:HD domain-containing protein [Bacteroidales bacterium]